MIQISSWLKGLTKEELEELRKFKTKAGKNGKMELGIDFLYFIMTVSLVLFSIFAGNFVTKQSQLELSNPSDSIIVKGLNFELREIINIGNYTKDFEEIKTYDFNCQTFRDGNVFGLFPDMSYYCAITGYDTDIAESNQNFEKSISAIIYYRSLLYSKVSDEFQIEQDNKYELFNNCRNDSTCKATDTKFDEWQNTIKENSQKRTTIEKLLDSYSTTARERITNYRQSDANLKFAFYSLITAILTGLLWSLAKNKFVKKP